VASRIDDSTIRPRSRSSAPVRRRSAVTGRPPPRRRGARASAGVHRRRRALAIVGLVLLAIAVAAVAGGGASERKRSEASSPPGLFDRIRTLAGTGPGSLLADRERALNAAVTRTLAYTPYVRVAGAQHREIALTFDDGPGPYTPEVLSILEHEDVPATFFEVGFEEQWFHDSTTRIAHDGDVIGDHTERHAPMAQLSPADQESQLLEQAAAIGRYGGRFPRLFRPPYGVWNAATLTLLARYRMLMVLWTVDTDDYEQPGVTAIVDSVLDGARPGAIVLLHDAGGNRTDTVAALPIIIHDLRARGYKLVTVPQLLLDNPAPRDQDIVGVTGLSGG
jgi:peptidoglycan/xylan/chitin deacetylase (PgdA/CDA1 family)